MTEAFAGRDGNTGDGNDATAGRGLNLAQTTAGLNDAAAARTSNGTAPNDGVPGSTAPTNSSGAQATQPHG